MTSDTTEIALERSIEESLTGIRREDWDKEGARDPNRSYGGHGYYLGHSADFDPKLAIDTRRFWHFLETTQGEELEKLKRASDWKLKITERLNRMIAKNGVLYVLRKGLDVENAHFTFFFQPPLASSSQIAKENFQKNEFSVTRQVHYNLDKPTESIDIVLFLNGLAIATFELKNPWTNQTARDHGQKQYKFQRDIRQPLLTFGRCVVHFTLDKDEVYMTTRLAGKDTFFLPFNKGNNFGSGNPVNPGGHKSAYLWKEILTRESVANILQHFVRLSGKPSDPLNSRTLFFPRYHQLDVVRKIVDDCAHKGVGRSYLVQHSAGSGKSNSITWAAYQLIEVYPEREDLPGAKGVDKPLFDSVIVVTDRRLLDKQIRENIKEFSEVKNIVSPAYSSKELKEGLESGKKIIITTIQKFPQIVDGISDLSDRRFAVLIDEAHSSQGGIAAAKLNQAMGNTSEASKDMEEEELDVQDLILEVMRARKMKGNASYLAFTATPKNTTLERFGERQKDGSFRPFHLYSMKQAIEEGFILDVLANYTTYRSYYEITKSVEENPLFSKQRAQKKLRTYVERHPTSIKEKAEIMVEHFLKSVYGARKLKGKAKAMVVTQNIESAIRYYKEIVKLLGTRGKPFKVLIAFSGKKTVDGKEYSEEGINDFSESETRKKFNSDEYRILVVANKYLTGFDQPLLSTMYVDKKLQGVMAVQALSRLNRAANDYHKRKEDLFILDFFNNAQDIKEAFDPFYTSTSLTSPTDVNVLHELKNALDDVGVYEQAEVNDMAALFFRDAPSGEWSPILQTAVERFNEGLELEDKEKADFKIKAKQFVKIYGQVAAILDYEMQEWEKLFWFLKFLIPDLVVKTKEDEEIDALLESVDLSTYALERTRLSAPIGLDSSDSELKPPNPNPRGVKEEQDDRDTLEKIIAEFNERWFQGWDETPENQRIKFIRMKEDIQQHPDFKEKFAQNSDQQNRDLALRKILRDVMANQRKRELQLYKLYAEDEAFSGALFNAMKQMVEEKAG